MKGLLIVYLFCFNSAKTFGFCRHPKKEKIIIGRVGCFELYNWMFDYFFYENIPNNVILCTCESPSIVLNLNYYSSSWEILILELIHYFTSFDLRKCLYNIFIFYFSTQKFMDTLHISLDRYSQNVGLWHKANNTWFLFTDFWRLSNLYLCWIEWIVYDFNYHFTFLNNDLNRDCFWY